MFLGYMDIVTMCNFNEKNRGMLCTQVKTICSFCACKHNPNNNRNSNSTFKVFTVRNIHILDEISYIMMHCKEYLLFSGKQSRNMLDFFLICNNRLLVFVNYITKRKI